MSRQTERRKKAEKQKRDLHKAARAMRRATATPPPTDKSQSGRPLFSLSDLLALLALPLAVAGMLIDNIPGVATCLALAAAIPCVAILRHSEIALQYRLFASASCIATFGILVFVLNAEHEKRELAKNEGILYPSNLPRPQSNCKIADSDFAIYAGGGVAFGSKEPTTYLSIAGQEIISAEKLENGSLRLRTVRLYDDQNEIIARITENGLWVHPSARRQRPDSSTLIVYDRRDKEVLNMKFLNPNSVSIKGIFRAPGRSPIIVSDSGVEIATNVYVAQCMSNAPTGFGIN